MTQNITYPKYPNYKDSGVEWLGEIPEEWGIERLGSLLSPKSIKGRPNLPLLSITRELGVIERDLEDEDSNHNYIPEDLSGYKVIQKGQFGMNKMKAWQGSYGISPITGIISPAYYVFDFTRKIDPSFFHIAIRSKSYVAFFGQASDGVRIGQWDLSKSRMKSIPFILPPLPEQTAIANFLDDKCAKIDRAIEQKEKLIALLKERKQIVIQNAVTKGLDPNVEMRDSGVEWIGEIPEGWEVVEMKYAIKAIGDIDHYMPLTTESGIPYVMTGDLEEFASSIQFDSCKKVSHKDFYKLSKKIRISKGDVILARYATIGTSSYIDIDLDFLVSYSCVTIKPNPSKLLGFYLFFYFKSNAFAVNIKDHVNTNTQGNVGIGDLRKTKLVLPPINEQHGIIEQLYKEDILFNKLVTLQQTQIEKLKEYKATLIDSAVRGKIKVS